MGKERKYVRKYKTKVRQCSNCWWFGHTAENCKKYKTCENCSAKGNEHESGTCSINPKCRSCNKAHKASDKKCPMWKKQLAVAKIRTDHSIGYMAALEVYKKQNKNKPQTEFYLGAESGSDPEYVPQKNKFFNYKNINESSSDSDDSDSKSYRQVLKKALKKAKKAKQKSLFSITDSEDDLDESLYSLGLSESEPSMSQTSKKVANKKRQYIRASGRIRQVNIAEPESETGTSYNMNQRHISVQTNTCSNKFTQTNMNFNKSIKNFLKEMVNAISVKSGRPSISTRRITNTVNKFFCLNVDSNWTINALRK